MSLHTSTCTAPYRNEVSFCGLIFIHGVIIFVVFVGGFEPINQEFNEHLSLWMKISSEGHKMINLGRRHIK